MGKTEGVREERVGGGKGGKEGGGREKGGRERRERGEREGKSEVYQYVFGAYVVRVCVVHPWCVFECVVRA